jgi:hypothetical protein
MVHQELVSQQNITHWSHTKVMEWFSNNRRFAVTANYFSSQSDELNVVSNIIYDRGCNPKIDLL